MKDTKINRLPLLIIIFLLLLYGKYLWIYIPLILLILIELSTKSLRLYVYALKKTVKIIGTVNNWVFLTITYFLIIIPISFFYKKSKKSKINYYTNSSIPSTFLNVDYKIDRASFFNQW